MNKTDGILAMIEQRIRKPTGSFEGPRRQIFPTKVVRAALIAMVVAISGLLTSGPANAQDRDEFLRRTHSECERGDREACRIHHLYNECQRGERRACDEINRERYHERVQNHEHEQGREEFLRKTHFQCEQGNREACRIHHLYSECEHGDRRACDEINRERYHERR